MSGVHCFNAQTNHSGAYPPPVSFPTPCRSLGGGVTWSTQNFSLQLIVLLCCVVGHYHLHPLHSWQDILLISAEMELGGCVVGHYHLHPLHSWQDILLTFAEMDFDSTTMFPPGTSVMFIRSTGEPVLAQVVGYSQHGDAYCRICSLAVDAVRLDCRKGPATRCAYHFIGAVFFLSSLGTRQFVCFCVVGGPRLCEWPSPRRLCVRLPRI